MAKNQFNDDQSNEDTSIKSQANETKSSDEFARSWSLITLGCALLIVAGGLFYWGFTSRPKPAPPLTPTEQIQRQPPANPAKESGTQVPTPEQPKPSSLLKRTTSKRPSVNQKGNSVESPNNRLKTTLEERIKRIEAQQTSQTPQPAVGGERVLKRMEALIGAFPSPSQLSSASPTAVSSLASALPSPDKTPSPVTATVPAPAVSSSPAPTPINPAEAKRPNAIRRFLSWIGGGLARLFKKRKPITNLPPEVSVSSSIDSILRSCRPPARSKTCEPTGSEVQLTAKATDTDNDQLLYTWSVTGGRLSGEGRTVTWDLTGVANGTYTATVEVNDGNQHTANCSTTVTVAYCSGCERPPPLCPQVSVSCPDAFNPRAPIAFTASVTGIVEDFNPNYNWSVSAGTITSGQGTSTIIVDTAGLGGRSVTATVSVGGADPSCGNTNSCTSEVRGTDPTGSITGVIRQGDKLLRDVEVIAKLRGGGAYVGRTNERGQFFIVGVPHGFYDVRAFSEMFSEVSVSGGRPAVVNFSFAMVDPSPNPSPFASPSPVPSHSPDHNPSPAPSLPTPSPAPTQSATKVVAIESDQITANYPDKFLQGLNDRVTVELQRVWREVKEVVLVDANTGKVTRVAKPEHLPGAKPDTITPASNEGLYDTLVTMRLTGKGLIITALKDETQFYSKAGASPAKDQKLDWEWDVRPESGVTKDAQLHFEMLVIWRSTDPQVASPEPQRGWHADQPVVIGNSGLLVYGSTYGSPFVFLGGAGIITKGAKKRRRRGAAEVEDEDDTADEVTGSVYAPQFVRPGDAFQVQVFLQLAGEETDPLEEAQRSDPSSTLRDSSPLKKKIESRTELNLYLTIPDVEIADPKQSATWEGKQLKVRFNVKVPRRMKPVNLLATVIIAAESVPIGDLSFIIAVTRAEGAPQDPAQALAVKVRPYKYAFMSYTSTDRPDVLRCAQILRIFEIGFFQDLLSLEPGDEFEPAIYREIDKSDVFLLFWSTAASKSKWVRKEIKHAVERQKGKHGAPPKIIPIIIEGPPPAKPPRALRFLHFNDTMVYFVDSAEAEKVKKQSGATNA